MSFVGISTLHDPDSRLYSLIEKNITTIKSLFEDLVVCVTEKSGEEILNLFRTHNIHTLTDSSIKLITPYKKAIKKGLEFCKTNQKLFYVDFDRLVHWIITYPKELGEILAENMVDFTLVGRTSRAFETHPVVMKETEIIINKLVSNVLSIDPVSDIISTCWVFTKELASSLLMLKLESSTGFYSVWPLYLWKMAPTKTYIEVEGLEYETPDRFIKEIQQVGYESWLSDMNTTNEWRRRVSIVRDGLNDLQLIGNLDIKSKLFLS